MTKIYSANLSAGGYVGPKVSLTAPGQRHIVIDRRYSPPMVLEVRADSIVGNCMQVSMRPAGTRRHFTPANPLRCEPA